MTEPNPLPLVRDRFDKQQSLRPMLILDEVGNEPLPGRGKTDMAIQTAQRHAEHSETEQ